MGLKKVTILQRVYFARKWISPDFFNVIFANVSQQKKLLESSNFLPYRLTLKKNNMFSHSCIIFDASFASISTYKRLIKFVICNQQVTSSNNHSSRNFTVVGYENVYILYFFVQIFFNMCS